MSARVFAVLILAAATLLAAIDVRAQAIFMTAPQELFNLKFDRVRPQVATPAPIIPAPTQARPEPTNRASVSATPASDETIERPFGAGVVLRHLTNNIQGYRLAGEIGASEWPIYVTEAQAKRRLQFQLGYLAAVSIMPEASALTLTINDRAIGETPIRAAQAVKTVVFDIPAGAMRPGFNSVRLSTNQRHRVDCSLDATYELWTQIDPTQTGLVLAESDAGVDTLADLGALPPDEQGALPIRAVLPAKPRPSDVERMLRAAQLISIIGRFEQPVVDAGPLAAGRYGINLLVGTAAELAKETNFDALAAVASPRAMVFPATPGRRTTIVVTGATAAQVDEAMKQFLVATTPKGSPQGLRAAAAFPGFRMQGGQRVKLRDLGIVSEEFTGRLFRAAFNIIMPSDFYAADYDRARIRLAGGYAPGLSAKAQIVMSVNDRMAISLGLVKAAGDVFEDNPLPLPLGFLRPGLNRIEIEAHVPTNDDADCDPLGAIHAAKRFLFLDSTEIEMPAIARVARMPDLAVTASGGFPFAGAERPKLFMPALDQKAIGAAATIVAHLAIAAGRPIDFEIVGAPPGAGKGPTLAVAPLDALDPALLRRLGMPADGLRAAWKPQLAAEKNAPSDAVLSPSETANRNRLVLQRNFPMACYASRPMRSRNASEEVDDTPVASIAARRPQSSDARDLFEEWEAKLRGGGRWSFDIAGWLRRTGDWGVAKFADAASWMRSGSVRAVAEGRSASARTLLAMGQNILGDSGEDVWTVVTAPNSAALAEAAACLVDPRVSRQISGRLSTLDMAEAKVSVAPAESSRFIVTQPLSIGNLRLIAAGWMSLHSLAYVLSTLVIAGLLAVSTRWFVRNVGRKSE